MMDKIMVLVATALVGSLVTTAFFSVARLREYQQQPIARNITDWPSPASLESTKENLATEVKEALVDEGYGPNDVDSVIVEVIGAEGLSGEHRLRRISFDRFIVAAGFVEVDRAKDSGDIVLATVLMKDGSWFADKFDHGVGSYWAHFEVPDFSNVPREDPDDEPLELMIDVNDFLKLPHSKEEKQ